MQQSYSTGQVMQDKFLFISYSHSDQEIVRAWANYLADRGVMVWWDKEFSGGDDWESIATNVLAHENCCGFLFFCSPSAIQSDNVAKEWRQASKTKQSRSNEEFYAQIIMATDDPDFGYKAVLNVVKHSEEIYDDEDYDDFRELFGKKDHIFYSANNQGDQDKLVKTILKKVPQVVNEQKAIRGKLDDLSRTGKDVVLDLGVYGNQRKPLKWTMIQQDGDWVVLLSQEIMDDSHGGKQLEAWINEFVHSESFTPEERVVVQDSLRLLQTKEAEKLPQQVLATGRIWWLQECDGRLQKVVREDGTIYHYGYNNALYRKGVRLALSLDLTALNSLINKK